jgi:hypothetical protein
MLNPPIWVKGQIETPPRVVNSQERQIADNKRFKGRQRV